MPIKDDYDFSIIENTIRNKVIETLERELENNNSVCKCEECVIDIVCYALNRIKPNYTSSLYGGLYSRADADKREKDIEKEVKEAIGFVSVHSSHEKR